MVFFSLASMVFVLSDRICFVYLFLLELLVMFLSSRFHNPGFYYDCILHQICFFRYNVIGLSATIGEPFYRSIEVSSLALALMENIQSMEFRHMRQLIHLVIVPVIKNCPVDLWEVCIVNLLHPLLLHCHQALGFSWNGLLREGRAKLPDNLGNLTGKAIVQIILISYFLSFALRVNQTSKLNEGLRLN